VQGINKERAKGANADIPGGVCPVILASFFKLSAVFDNPFFLR
jgi:hypothetical protein